MNVLFTHRGRGSILGRVLPSSCYPGRVAAGRVPCRVVDVCLMPCTQWFFFRHCTASCPAPLCVTKCTYFVLSHDRSCFKRMWLSLQVGEGGNMEPVRKVVQGLLLEQQLKNFKSETTYMWDFSYITYHSNNYQYKSIIYRYMLYNSNKLWIHENHYAVGSLFKLRHVNQKRCI